MERSCFCTYFIEKCIVKTIPFWSLVFSSETLNLSLKFQIHLCPDEPPESGRKALVFFVLVANFTMSNKVLLIALVWLINK